MNTLFRDTFLKISSLVFRLYPSDYNQPAVQDWEVHAGDRDRDKAGNWHSHGVTGVETHSHGLR